VGDDATRKKTLKRRKKTPPLAANAVRASRAQRRGQWVRKTDVEGKIYWFRKVVADAVGNAPSANHTVRFEGSAFTVGKPTVAHVQWLDATASTTDAVAFPVGAGTLLAQATPLVQLSSQPFPTRYAEFVQRASALLPPQGRLRFRLKDASKPAVFSQAMAQLLSLQPSDLRCEIMIRLDTGTVFAGTTESVDWHRDWFATLGEQLAAAETGLFTCVDPVEQAYYINADSQAIVGNHHLDYFFATGRLLGSALLHGDLLAFHVAAPLLKILLGQPLSLHDLEHVDATTYKSLTSLLAMASDSEVTALALDFSVQEKRGGQVVTVDLIPNGRTITVTNANKHEFVTRMTQHVLVERLGDQLLALCSGFYEVVPQELLLLVTEAEELDYMLCGPDDIDVDEWERESKYDMYLFDHPAKKFFWKCVRELPEDYKRRLLHYATGSTRVPIGGFASLKTFDGRLAPFSLQSCELVDNELVKSQPCLNKLTLPLYVSKRQLKAHLMAVLDPETYEFSIAK
jgi:hypothetical protein